MQALWMVLASFLFATMGVGIKVASGSFGTAELVFYRGVIGVLFLGLVLRSQGIPLRSPVPTCLRRLSSWALNWRWYSSS